MVVLVEAVDVVSTEVAELRNLALGASNHLKNEAPNLKGLRETLTSKTEDVFFQAALYLKNIWKSGRTEADEFFVEKTVITTDEELIASGASGDDSDHGEPVLSPSESHNQTKNPASHESNSQRETPSSPYRPENSTPTSPYCPKNSPTP
ncbi:hypothetical protein V8B55DRAFT_1436990 [Mucor lusitanicus]|uniref:Uncharacterized protein n=1 Tax=Mucor lusitanicus CBS 277.49 TaxID=747725 RepID=A0A168GKM8_MUCCL|nr:hypothetical protein MUCCIDRAFT_115854 [Mucor lusitanicus CBS 277.49]